MPQTKWKDVAFDLIHRNWHQEYESVSDFIQKADDNRLQTILLCDIAESLRILRCSNFKNIPTILRAIEKNTRKPKKKVVKNGTPRTSKN